MQTTRVVIHLVQPCPSPATTSRGDIEKVRLDVEKLRIETKAEIEKLKNVIREEPVVIETDLTEEEHALIAKGVERYFFRRFFVA